jgi:hypothetical protein
LADFVFFGSNSTMPDFNSLPSAKVILCQSHDFVTATAASQACCVTVINSLPVAAAFSRSCHLCDSVICSAASMDCGLVVVASTPATPEAVSDELPFGASV